MDSEQKADKGKSRETALPPLPIPAVKGTIGGIESPRRNQFSPSYIGKGHGRESSISTLRADNSSTPSSSTPTQTPLPLSNTHDPSAENDLDQYQDRPVFRSDPTMKSCFDNLKLDGKDEIKRLFYVS
ncbi:hypothetical protein BCR39DRAFT_515158 [Naematelia encephala]|uniref:Uncharacterized protein n=1 Tax=Naematelia encephala TaxID=71784 RepID=A0A1Y2BJ99_9TREE|nr:hypothetical protein BCR39DRAFT_515158 [Naematelia encephala]